MTSEPTREWFLKTGRAIMHEVDRLWPEETDPAYRGACLAEEAGEVNRAITKRRHAMNADTGKCKGKDFHEWTLELQLELAQLISVAMGMAYREGFDIVTAIEACLGALRDRQPGT